MYMRQERVDQMNTRVTGYVRVSTDNQLENYSIEEQADRIHSYCRAKGWSLIKIYTDGGYSGGNTNRPALQQMLSDIHNDRIDLVVVYKLDRLSRSQKDTLMLIEDEFITNKVDFISINENFDTSTPFGKAMIGILSVFAQLEKDQITERFTMGRIGRAKNGFYHGGPTAPTGYDYVDGNLIVNEYEAIQVREVFRLFLEGQSIHAIQNHMSRNYTNKYGNWTSHTLVLHILRNAVYTSKVKFKKQVYPGNHEPIISEDIFHQAQALLKSNDRYHNGQYSKTPYRANNLLTGLLYCKKCGARYFGNHGKYTCYSRSKADKSKIRDAGCKNKHWHIEMLNTCIKASVLRLAFDNDYFDAILGKSNCEPAFNKDIIARRVKDIDKQIARMLDLYQTDGMPKEQISERLAKLKAEKDSIAEEPASKMQTNEAPAPAKDMLSGINDILTYGELPQQRLIILSLIDYIELDDDIIEIHWSFD